MKLFITHQRARSFGSFAYSSAKKGKLSLVSYGGEQFWMGHAGTRGFYLQAYSEAA